MRRVADSPGFACVTATRGPIRRSLHTALVALALASTCAVSETAVAQDFRTIQEAEDPLVLKSRGSFYVAGDQVEQTSVELGSLGPDDQVTRNQMYVEYMVPGGQAKVPIVLVHGATLSGKTYDTTPDGRMGWYEYFVRRQHPVYVVDQIGRARSGFDQSGFNNVRAGRAAPETQPTLLRLGDHFGSWTNFRIGPEPGQAYPDTQFPVEAAAELSKQSVPDLLGTSRASNPNRKALSDLALQLEGAVLLVHSQSGPYPLESALIDARGIRGIVMVEPGTCNAAKHTDADIAVLAKTPILILFGDQLDTETKLPGPNWQDRFNDCRTFAQRVEAADGDISLMTTTDAGHHGNSHMLMMDRNNLQIANLILGWIDRRTSR